VLVGKSGIFSFAAGHTHDVESNGLSGTISVDPEDLSRSSMRLVVRTSTLQVSPKGEPPDDVPKVQHTMQSEQVLDVAKYPEIIFESTRVELKSRNGAAIELAVSGRLTLHGATHPVTVPVHAELGDSSLTANGRFEVKQTDYGIKPVSVAGVVSVKDALDITFTIVARE
jgi:polyisoprenoid-binding protein YceI